MVSWCVLVMMVAHGRGGVNCADVGAMGGVAGGLMGAFGGWGKCAILKVRRAVRGEVKGVGRGEKRHLLGGDCRPNWNLNHFDMHCVKMTWLCI